MIAFILNLPWTLEGLVAGLFSGPSKIYFNFRPFAIVFEVRTFWWARVFKIYAKMRACAMGHVILLGPKTLPKDFEHEVVHINQHVS